MVTLQRNRNQAPDSEAHESECAHLLTFQLGGETFALAIAGVKEILQYHGLTEVPLMPPFIRGVMNLRGQVIPVIDLSQRFGRAETVIKKRTCVMVIEVEFEGTQQWLGILADAVHEVLSVDTADIEPSPPFGCNIRSDFISGMARIAGQFVVWLDIRHVLSIEDMTLLSSIDVPTEPLSE